MKISVSRRGPDLFTVAVGETQFNLTETGLQALVREAGRALGAPAASADDPALTIRRFLGRLRRANDVGVQALLQAADHNDVLFLLKTVERDKDLTTKFLHNMSANSRTMYVEDLAFKFRQGAPRDQAMAALGRIMALATELEKSGPLRYEKPSR